MPDLMVDASPFAAKVKHEFGSFWVFLCFFTFVDFISLFSVIQF